MDTNPRKYLIRNLVVESSPKPVWLQGTIEQTIMKDILLISDGTGKAKITKCETADGIINRSVLVKGTYCCIIGTTVKSKGLPEIQASKILDLSSKLHMKDSWETEVKEADLFLQNKIKFSNDS